MQLNNVRVWVVEDNENNALVVQTLLQVSGVSESRWLQSGTELFKALESVSNQGGVPHVILLDIQLPGEDGYAILQRIRADQRLTETKVVAVTANVMPQDIKQARDAGFDGFIGKPINRRQFDSILEQVISGESVWRPR